MCVEVVKYVMELDVVGFGGVWWIVDSLVWVGIFYLIMFCFLYDCWIVEVVCFL